MNIQNKKGQRRRNNDGCEREVDNTDNLMIPALSYRQVKKDKEMYAWQTIFLNSSVTVLMVVEGSVLSRNRQQSCGSNGKGSRDVVKQCRKEHLKFSSSARQD